MPVRQRYAGAAVSLLQQKETATRHLKAGWKRALEMRNAGKNEPPFENEFDYWCARKMLNLGGPENGEKDRNHPETSLANGQLRHVPFWFLYGSRCALPLEHNFQIAPLSWSGFGFGKGGT